MDVFDYLRQKLAKRRPITSVHDILSYHLWISTQSSERSYNILVRSVENLRSDRNLLIDFPDIINVIDIELQRKGYLAISQTNHVTTKETPGLEEDDQSRFNACIRNLMSLDVQVKFTDNKLVDIGLFSQKLKSDKHDSVEDVLAFFEIPSSDGSVYDHPPIDLNELSINEQRGQAQFSLFIKQETCNFMQDTHSTCGPIAPLFNVPLRDKLFYLRRSTPDAVSRVVPGMLTELKAESKSIQLLIQSLQRVETALRLCALLSKFFVFCIIPSAAWIVGLKRDVDVTYRPSALRQSITLFLTSHASLYRIYGAIHRAAIKNPNLMFTSDAYLLANSLMSVINELPSLQKYNVPSPYHYRTINRASSGSIIYGITIPTFCKKKPYRVKGIQKGKESAVVCIKVVKSRTEWLHESSALAAVQPRWLFGLWSSGTGRGIVPTNTLISISGNEEDDEEEEDFANVSLEQQFDAVGLHDINVDIDGNYAKNNPISVTAPVSSYLDSYWEWSSTNLKPSNRCEGGGCVIMHWGSLINPIKAQSSQIHAEVFACLSALHQKGFVHRDVRLRNIVWFPQFNKWELIDFGQCRSISHKGDISSTMKINGGYRLQNTKYEDLDNFQWTQQDDFEMLYTACIQLTEELQPRI